MRCRRERVPGFPPSRAEWAAAMTLAALPFATNPLAAQDLQPAPLEQAPLPPPTSANDNQGNRQITFEADAVSYDSTNTVITAKGNVLLRNGERSVRADKVTYNSKTGKILATGRVRFVDDSGNQLFTDSVELTDKFEAGSLQDLLIALRQGGRLAAKSGERKSNGDVELHYAAYTGCPVETSDGCPKKPTWKITARRVIYDPANDKVRFTGAHLELFGARILPIPSLAIRTDGGPVNGFLVPDFRVSRNNGIEVSDSYYMRFGDNKDLTASAYIFSQAPPMVSGEWRHLTGIGAYQVTGYLTESKRASNLTGTSTDTTRDPRGYLFTNGKFQFDPNWSLTTSIRLASDRTFLRRYDISYDDRLRSMVNLERIDDSSYLSIAGWYTQTLRLNQVQGQQPIALPAIDYRKRLADPLAGGTIELQVNSLDLIRTEGQDTQRAFAKAQWDLRRITPWGQVVQLTGLVRGDVYHSDANDLTTTPIYQGLPGWQARGIAAAAVDVSWPLVGKAFGGEQVLTPRVQLVATPPIRNLQVPNEDSRAVDLEDTNLFSINRYPGFDRFEDGVRLTYGVDWQLRRPGWKVEATLGQSYRFTGSTDILVDGTGFYNRLSDYVGRVEVRYKDFVKLTHRFRLDKDNFAVRDNEIDATIGSSKTYLEVGYLRLNRNITQIEDLQDREELRAATRVAFAKYWSAFGSGVFNLTNSQEDPTFTSNGFQPIRTRLGLAYRDDCLELGVTWQRDYVTAGDAQRGNSFQVYFSLRNLGIR